MNEEERLRTNFNKNMIYNVISFTFILTLFAIIVYVIVKTLVYRQVDDELFAIRNNLLANNDYEQIKDDFKPDEDDLKLIEYDDLVNYNLKYITEKVGSITTNLLIWDNKNLVMVKYGYLAKYDFDYEFDRLSIDHAKVIKLGGDHYFRVLNFSYDYNQDGVKDDCQLLINIDTEKYLEDCLIQIIVMTGIVSVVISIIISYILTKNSLKPIIMNMKTHTEFVQNASHELRTPLTIIQAKQELLLSDPEARIVDKIEDISITLEETKRLTRLTQDLLTLTRADNSVMKISKEKINIDELIDSKVKNYAELAEIQQKTITTNLNFKRNIMIDKNLISQLLLILIDNALKYTEENDKIDISSYYKSGNCFIEVKDTGIGVSEEGLTRIFDRFYRDDKARNREKGGTGLGLSIASSIVKKHNGSIVAQHNNPKGTVFIVRLPVK